VAAGELGIHEADRSCGKAIADVNGCSEINSLVGDPGVGMAGRAAGTLIAELGFPKVDATTAEGGTVEANPTAGELCGVK
jgi:hypothetical protein